MHYHHISHHNDDDDYNYISNYHHHNDNNNNYNHNYNNNNYNHNYNNHFNPNPYTAPNSEQFSIDCTSYYLSTATNTISVSPTDDLQDCLDLCSTTAGCLFADWVNNPSAGNFQDCYLLSSNDGGLFTYTGISSGTLVTS
ncbi:hypothetical protein AYO22_07485 [Fonsecaea multimorphosa]|nr:hypothetical protein AYO22_07485 [Fonsecaea multimorphosa]